MTESGVRLTRQFMLNLLGTAIISYIGYLFIGNAIEGPSTLMTGMILIAGGPFIVAYLLIALFGLQIAYKSIWESNSIEGYVGAGVLLFVPFVLSWITSAYFQTSMALSISLFVWSFFVFLVSGGMEASREKYSASKDKDIV